MRVPSALQLARTIQQDQLRQPEDTKNANIRGMQKTDMDVLVLADFANGAVKSLDVSTGRVMTVWRIEQNDQAQGWRVSNARMWAAPESAAGGQSPEGHVLLVVEKKSGKGEWRVCTANRRGGSVSDGSFLTVLRESLPQTRSVYIF